MKYGNNRGSWSGKGSMSSALNKFKKTARRKIRLSSIKK